MEINERICNIKKAEIMVENLKQINNKQKFWLEYLKTIWNLGNILKDMFGICIIAYLIGYSVFKGTPINLNNLILLLLLFVSIIICQILKSLMRIRYDYLNNQSDKLWQDYEQFKKDNNLK